MGVVYRARDPRLGRDVALKVLRASAVAGADIKNILREARTAGSLNHPNIVAVFDVGTEGDVPYVVTELLAGETLRDRLRRGPVPYRKAVEYGIQIAQALDAAHAKGIWHRDVKPANVFLTEDGRVKLLDFGIAKVATGRAGPDDSTTEATKSRQILGTAAYMSPEQVLGHPLDHRTDVFSLGAVLFEMFTGSGPFVRDTPVDSMSAVLHTDPPDPLALNPSLPPGAVALVRRCLEKNREERFQSVRDLAFGLQQLRETTGSARPLAPARWPPRAWVLPATLAAAIAVGAAGAMLLWPLVHKRAAPSFEQLTFRRGRIGGARFSSDAQAVVYSQAREGNALEVSRVELAESESRSLGFEAGTDVFAARQGELALGLRCRFIIGERFVGTLAFAPSGGGSPKEIAENVEDADWDPSGTRVAVVRSTGEIGGDSRIEFPAGQARYTTKRASIRFVRVSRDGQRVAFLEDPQGRGIGGRVKVLDLSGDVKDLTEEWVSARGLAWSKDGDEVWFAAGASNTSRALRAVNVRRQQRVILETAGSLTLWDVATDGRVLLSQDEERGAMVGQRPGESVERDLSWLDNSSVANLSSDGKWVMFADRPGIYLRETDGSAPIYLGLKGAYGDELSPDGRTVLATSEDLRQLILVPKGAGDPRPLPSHNIVAYRGAHWFPDGRRILFVGQEAGHEPRSYVQDLDGHAPTALTPENFRALSISPNGDWAAAVGPDQTISLWPVAGGPSRLVSGAQPGERPVAWSADGQSLWLFRRDEVPAHVYKLSIQSGRRELWKTLIPSDSAGVYSIFQFQVTPDGRAYAYSYLRLLSQLYLAKGLK
jgi:Tol biopolymer transport system component